MEVLVKYINNNQWQACDACKYYGKCSSAPHETNSDIYCQAKNGQYYDPNYTEQFIIEEDNHNLIRILKKYKIK